MARDCKLMTHTKNTIANEFQEKKQKKNWKKWEEKESSMISLCTTEKQNLWHLDSGCSKHMTVDPNKFIKLRKDNKGRITLEII